MLSGQCRLEIRGERLECSFSGWHAQNEVMGVENVLDESELPVPRLTEPWHKIRDLR